MTYRYRQAERAWATADLTCLLTETSMTLISDVKVTVEVADTVELVGATVAMFIFIYATGL